MSTFCTGCGTSMNADEKFCRTCGKEAAVPPGTASAAQLAATGPTETSGKAIASLIFGLFIFAFPFSIVAIILGHLSLSEIPKSAGRGAGEGLATAGLVLGYIGVAGMIPVMLIIAAIAIPNFLRARMAANESSAVAAVRTINTAEIVYSEEHPGSGYTCALSDLGQLISGGLASGRKNGYAFELMGCMPGDEGGANKKYQVVAYPVSVNQTGARAFCSDESGVIRVDGGGSAENCLQNGAPLQ